MNVYENKILEHHPEVISQRELAWENYCGDKPVQMIHGQNLFLLPGDDYSKQLFVYRRQHIGLLLALARISFPVGGGVAVDVGANIGYLTTLLAMRPDIEKVIAFEPNTEALSILRRNSSERVHSENLLVGESSKQTKAFALNESNSGWSGLGSVRNSHPHRIVHLQQTSLDDYFANSTITGKCVLLKIDVEGSEAGVLRGARKLIESDTPTLVVEYNHKSKELKSELNRIQQEVGGYQTFYADSAGFLHYSKISRFQLEHNDLIMIPKNIKIRK